jgi:hypothetical protein
MHGIFGTLDTPMAQMKTHLHLATKDKFMKKNFIFIISIRKIFKSIKSPNQSHLIS